MKWLILNLNVSNDYIVQICDDIVFYKKSIIKIFKIIIRIILKKIIRFKKKLWAGNLAYSRLKKILNYPKKREDISFIFED